MEHCHETWTEESGRSGGESRTRNRHLSGLATGVCGSVKTLWLYPARQFVHPSGATILGALRFGARRVPLQYRPFDNTHALICSLGAVGHDLSRCVATLVGPPNVFPAAAMLRDSDADCTGLALEASYAVHGLSQCVPPTPLLLSACPGQRNTDETRKAGLAIEAGDRARIVDAGRLGDDRCMGYAFRGIEGGDGPIGVAYKAVLGSSRVRVGACNIPNLIYRDVIFGYRPGQLIDADHPLGRPHKAAPLIWGAEGGVPARDRALGIDSLGKGRCGASRGRRKTHREREAITVRVCHKTNRC